MNKKNIIKTGDALLFSGNTPTGFLLKTSIASSWNHAGIAIRFKKSNDILEISLDNSGELYILETNSVERYDDFAKQSVVGVGFSKGDWVFQKYTRVAIRPLHNKFRNQKLIESTLKFYNNYKSTKFPGGILPFFEVWIGVIFRSKNELKKEMFCSEIMANYYLESIGEQYEFENNQKFSGDLKLLFGPEAPETADLFTPEHYTYRKTPNSAIFFGSEQTIYVSSSDLFYVILQPLLIILFFMLVIWMLLR